MLMKLAQAHQVDFGTARLPVAEAEDSAEKERQDFPLIIATMPATERQRVIAVGTVVFLIVAAAIIAPFASIQLPRVDVFIPVLQTVVCVADLVTATLLFAQFSIQPQRALLALASGYIFSGSFAFLQTLAFPGAYAPAGLFGDASTAAWMFVLWHTTFPAAILVYALSKDVTGFATLPGRSAMTSIVTTVVCVLAVIAATDLDRDDENGISPELLHHRHQIADAVWQSDQFCALAVDFDGARGVICTSDARFSICG